MIRTGLRRTRLKLLFRLARNGFDHAAERMRPDAVGADVVALHVHRDVPRQARDAHLGGAIVHLADAADQAGGGGDVGVAAAFLLAEMRDRRAGDIERTIKVNLDHRVPLFDRHVVEHAIT